MVPLTSLSERTNPSEWAASGRSGSLDARTHLRKRKIMIRKNKGHKKNVMSDCIHFGSVVRK